MAARYFRRHQLAPRCARAARMAANSINSWLWRKYHAGAAAGGGIIGVRNGKRRTPSNAARKSAVAGAAMAGSARHHGISRSA